MKSFPLPLACITALLLAGCMLGPDHVRPALEMPQAFRAADGWKPAEARDLEAHEPWWERYGDPLLDALVPQVAVANQSVLAAEARYRQALAILAGSRADALPVLDAGLSSSRSRSPDAGTGKGASHASSSRFALASSWEIDLWGRLRRRIEADAESTRAGEAELAAVRLSAQAALVQSYLQLRVNDAQQRLLARTLEAYARSLEITRNRRAAGVASRAEVAQAETQLRSAESQAIDLRVRRAQLESAIALLVGRPPSAFAIDADERVPALPPLPGALPSTLLERRPDVAAAERRVAAASAGIGVTRAAWFPTLTLGASAGFQHTGLADLFALPHRFWAVGPALAQTLFDGGARRAANDHAVAVHEQSVADYRLTVLEALRETEDSLAGLRILADEHAVQIEAVRAANEFLALTNNQYLAGTVSYLNVAIAQAAALGAERAHLDLLERRLLASVALIRALGGGAWDAEAAAAAASPAAPRPPT